MNNFVIIGGGPVGLIFAVTLNTLTMNKTSITVVELRKKYQRQQVLSLGKRVINMIPSEIIESLIQTQGCYINPPLFDRRGACYKKTYTEAQQIGITISSLEKELEKYIKKKTQIEIIKPKYSNKLKIKLQQNNVVIDDGIDHRIIDYDYLIGADGIGSEVRKTFFDNERILVLPDTMYGLTMIISTDRNTRVYSKEKKTAPPKLNYGQDRVRFFRQTNNTVYLAIALTPEEFVFFNQSKGKISNNLKFIIKQYMKLFDIECGNLDDCILDVSYFPIGIYRAKNFTDGKRFLVGDAAYNSHYFTGTGANVGMDNANYLATLFAKYIDNEINHQQLIAQYVEKMEKGIAFIKDRVLEVRTDYLDLWDQCKNMTLKDLKVMAKLANIPQSYFNKKELCYLLKQQLTINFDNK